VAGSEILGNVVLLLLWLLVLERFLVRSRRVVLGLEVLHGRLLLVVHLLRGLLVVEPGVLVGVLGKGGLVLLLEVVLSAIETGR